jgi:uncharacterized protein YggE
MVPAMPVAATRLARFAALVVAGLTAAGVAGCDSKTGPVSAAGKDTRQVTVVGNGRVKGTPDTLTTNVSIEFTAPEVTAAMNQTSERQQAVITALVDAGVDRKDISTTGVSLQPQYAASGETGNIVGYRATNSIDVRIRDVSAAPRALALIVSSGGDATRINTVNFSIDDDSQLVRDARTRAFDDAKARAQQYAQLAGLKLGSVMSISETGTGPPPTPYPAPKPAMTEAVPLEPGQQTVGFSVTVVWQLS